MLTSVLFAARLLLGSIFLIAGLGKRSSTTSFVEEIADYQLLSKRQARIAARILPFAESILGVLCITGFSLPLTSILLIFLLLIFTVAIIINLVRGRRFSCHCFGRSETPIGPTVIVRNTLLVVLASWVFISSPLMLSINSLVALWQKDIQQLTYPGTVLPVGGVVILSLTIFWLLGETGSVFGSEAPV